MSDTASEMLTGAGQADAAPASAENAGNAPWYGEVDADTVGYIENKGWKDPGSAIEGYRNLEKLLGADKAGNSVILPKDGDTEAWQDFYNKIGRPAEASAYKFAESEVSDEKVTEWFRGKAHELGLTQDQAAQLYDSWNEVNASQMKELEEKSSFDTEQELNDLKKEWGLAYEKNTGAAKKAATRFGFNEEELSAIEQVIGPKALMQRMAEVGKALGEDSFIGGAGDDAQFVMSPASAQSQIKELQMDANFIAAYTDPGNPGHAAAMDKMNRLHKSAYPG